jgi:hypothetical protein
MSENRDERRISRFEIVSGIFLIIVCTIIILICLHYQEKYCQTEVQKLNPTLEVKGGFGKCRFYENGRQLFGQELNKVK